MSTQKIIPSQNQLDTMTDLAADGATRLEIAAAMGISKRTLARLVISNEFPEVKERYLAAKQAYASDLADDIMRQASSPLLDDPKLANAEVQRRRLIVETSKWVAQKLLPKVYGDNLHIAHNHTGTIALSPLAQLRQLEAPAPRVIDVTPSIEAITVHTDDCF
jgi:transcriptional regulator with XRE-family HTH domain